MRNEIAGGKRRGGRRRITLTIGALLVAVLLLVPVALAISATWTSYNYQIIPDVAPYWAYTKWPVQAKAGASFFSYVWASSNKLSRYDPASNLWTSVTPSGGTPTPREGACMAFLGARANGDQELVVFGGKKLSDGTLSQETDRFDLGASKWDVSTIANAPSARW